MKKFVYKIMTAVLLAIGVYLVAIMIVQLIPPQFTEDYGAAAIDKYNRLMELNSPKIILVGGSGFAFGINSEKIEKEIGMPVVNLGLHAALEGHFMLEMAKANIGEGDIVVLALEYGIYPENGVNSENVLTTVENYPFLWKMVDVHDYPKLAREYFQVYGVTKISRFVTGKSKEIRDYNRASFNQYGDISYHREKQKDREDVPTVRIDKDMISDNLIAQINCLVRFAEEKGAVVFFSFPAVEEDAILSDESEINDFVTYLHENVGAVFISDIHNYFLPSAMFYDTVYHLTSEGAEIRTRQLITDLKSATDLNKDIGETNGI